MKNVMPTFQYCVTSENYKQKKDSHSIPLITRMFSPLLGFHTLNVASSDTVHIVFPLSTKISRYYTIVHLVRVNSIKELKC